MIPRLGDEREGNGINAIKKTPPAEAQTLLQTAFSQVAISQDAYTFILTGTCAVEMRGVEPLSEGSCAELSPSAVSVLTFPSPRAR